MELLPGSPGCFVCDNDESNSRSLHLKLFWNEEEKMVYIPFTADKSWCGYSGVVHGGVLASIFDDAMAWAVRKESGEWGVTADFHIRYRKPVLADKNYTVKGKLENQRGRKFKTSAQILDTESNVLAEADALFVGISRADTHNKEEAF